MDDSIGRDIGPDETVTPIQDLEMDIAIEPFDDPSDNNSSQFHSIYTSSQENNISSMPPGYTEHRVYGTDRRVWTRFVEEPLDMTPPSLNPLTRYDAELELEDCSENNPLNHEAARLQTFDSKWPAKSPVTPQDLARNGFYYTGPGDRVQCVFCSGVLKQWSYGDRVEEEHRKHFPYCPVHSSTSSRDLPHSDSMGIMTKCSDEIPQIENLGIVENKPRHPRYAIESDRLATCSGWPSQMNQKPEDLARAGLFYLGQGDKVKCFSCDGTIHSWEPQDDPMSEHIRWFPDCAFVKLTRGDDSQRGKTVTDAERVKTSAPVQALVDNGYSLESISIAINQLHIDGVHENTIPPAEEILKTILETDSAPSVSSNTQSPPTKLQNGQDSDHEVKALLDENRELKEQRLCKICLENEISVIFLPCGHLACCRQCGTSLTECPICRTVIRGTAKAYWA